MPSTSTRGMSRGLAMARKELGLSPEAVQWLSERRFVGSQVREDGPVLPDDETADRLLTRLGADPRDRADTLAARPDPERHQALWWVLDLMYRHQLSVLGECLPIEGLPGWPALPASTGPVGAHLYVWLYLAALPKVLAYHAERGIPEEVSWSSLGVGQGMRAHRNFTGHSGLSLFSTWTPQVHLRGAQFSFGRLDFNRGAVSFGNGACGYAVAVHIPATGRLGAEECDRSLAQAREFFGHYFPEEPVAFFTCRSWLLDPQLAGYLPEGSNIVRFQQRFQLLPFLRETDEGDADHVVLGYVFERSAPGPEITADLLDELPQDSTLQRAYVTHLRAGRHWHERTGWLPFHEA